LLDRRTGQRDRLHLLDFRLDVHRRTVGKWLWGCAWWGRRLAGRILAVAAPVIGYFISALASAWFPVGDLQQAAS